ncbi:MAG: DUF3124 domain-containing protein [Anaerolineae bacterium]|nr:DUF3124 domain-containing protein [Anaerolineae bacterium]
MIALLESRRIVLFLAALVIALAACSPSPSQPAEVLPTLSPVDIADLDVVIGQTVFVPAYSAIFFGDADRLLPLTATLAIHNTDPQNPIIVKSVRYYDTDGNLAREFIDSPVLLNPLATTGFVVATDELETGWGTNFLVEWVAETPAFEPVIEAIMVSNRGTEGVSFVSSGRIVSEQRP